MSNSVQITSTDQSLSTNADNGEIVEGTVSIIVKEFAWSFLDNAPNYLVGCVIQKRCKYFYTFDFTHKFYLFRALWKVYFNWNLLPHLSIVLHMMSRRISMISLIVCHFEKREKYSIFMLIYTLYYSLIS